jgi:hypothetical protein
MIVYVFEHVQWRFVLDDRPAPRLGVKDRLETNLLLGNLYGIAWVCLLSREVEVEVEAEGPTATAARQPGAAGRGRASGRGRSPSPSPADKVE